MKKSSVPQLVGFNFQMLMLVLKGQYRHDQQGMESEC